MGLNARARILLNTMVSNLKDCAPFLEGEPPPLAPEKLAVWQTSIAEGTRLFEEGNAEMALAQFQQAYALATNHPGLQFRLGRALLTTGNTNAAKYHLQSARDMDAFRARADSRINEIIRRVSQSYPQETLNLVDAEQVFNSSSPSGITGAEFMCDHVHFRFHGNYLLARLQANAISKFIPHQSGSQGEWLDQEACARRLAFTDWNRYRFATALRRQMSGSLFRRQINHRELDARLQSEIQSLQNANKARQQLDELLMFNTNSLQAHLRLALFYAGQNQAKNAAKHFSEVLRIDPKNETARRYLSPSNTRSNTANRPGEPAITSPLAPKPESR